MGASGRYGRAKALCQPGGGKTTLTGALRGHATFEEAVPDLFRLLVWLRCAPQGSDHRLIQDHFWSRQRKWHKLLQHEIALQDQGEMSHQRRTRQTAWIQAAEDQHKQCGQGLPLSMTIAPNDILLGRHHGVRRPVLALTVLGWAEN